MYGYILRAAAAAFLMICASVSSASALETVTSMREGGYALAPFSFAKFCVDYPEECRADSGPSRVTLNGLRMAQLVEINHAVNAAIRPERDTSTFHYWRLDADAGDCNDYAVQKRHELLSLGWPAAAVALTVAKTGWGEGHLVVTVRTDQGDLVLDNLRSSIVPWRRTGYQFIMRQSGANPQFWVALNGGQVGQTFASRTLDNDKLAAASLANEAANNEVATATDDLEAEQSAPANPVAVAQAEPSAGRQIGDPLDLTHLGSSLRKPYLSAKRRVAELGTWLRETSLSMAKPAIGRLMADCFHVLEGSPTVVFAEAPNGLVFAAPEASTFM